ncbi:peptidylprolyl isomerase [Ferruginibacter paludis]|uniref:peptidylprolyl isomerase n=1 Tax=Ferruginibacter paludis TaxID=1310417 RepID=UPI0025B2E9AC|nr:peptidylprolyl isomerase [Ferruginibacter paludis]MDN3658643.1 peptidylprolyl isomerase [Ferruginibacter paludis]
MSTKKSFLLAGFFSLSCVAGMAQSAKVVADKIIAVVGDKVILKSDIDNTITDMQRQSPGVDIPANARCMTLEQSMGVKALVLQAERDSLPVSEEDVAADIDNQIRYFIGAYGSKEKLEEISGKSMYQLKEDFKDGFKERKLAAAMRDKIVGGIRITPNEVKAYFDKLPKDSLTFYESELEIGQIVVFPKASRESEEYCIEQLNQFKQQAESGKKDFKKLADIYSDDEATQKQNDGQLDLNRTQKGFDATFMGKAFALKEGQISSPFKSAFGYHIIQMVSRAGDDATVRHILKIPQITPAETEVAIKKLDSVRAKLIAGTMQFGEAVAKYSEDETSKFTGGRRTNNEGSTYITIDQLDKDLVVMLKDLKVGEFSQPKEFENERRKKGVRIVYLLSKSEPHRENIKDDYNKIAQRALEEKKNLALEKWFNEKVGTYYIKIDDEYKDCEEMKKWTNHATVATGK